MNSVIAYKQFSLGYGLAELFAPEISNLKAFTASVAESAKNFRNMFGVGDWDKECHDRDYSRGGSNDYDKGCTSHEKS